MLVGFALRSNHHGNQGVYLFAKLCRIPAGLLDASDRTGKQMSRRFTSSDMTAAWVRERSFAFPK
jgi:hypothetical protein